MLLAVADRRAGAVRQAMKHAGYAFHSYSTGSTGYLSAAYLTCCSSLAMLSQSLALLSFPPWLHPVQMLAEARGCGEVCSVDASLAERRRPA